MLAEDDEVVNDMKPKVIVLRTAGTNCDRETCYAFGAAGGEVELVHINTLFEKKKKLADYEILAIPGGFSYGDDVAAGKILANELKYKLHDEIRDFASSGKPIMGICNGFQVLVKAGLLPGFNGIDEKQRVTLSFNDTGRFECRWVYLEKKDNNKCIFTKNLKAMITLPIAHGEGKFVGENDDVISRLEKNGQVVFKYEDYNPNGSVHDIAGITNPYGNVLGMMPHPERYIHRFHHPRWTRGGVGEEGDGLVIFKNAIEYVKGKA